MIYDVIIVGAGIAGLTSAAYIGRKTDKVLLIEKNKVCGGLVNTIQDNGFTFDTGLKALEDAGIIIPMLKDLGISLNKVRSKVSVGIENDIINLNEKSDIDEYKDLLIKFYPENEKEIIRIIKAIKKISKLVDNLYSVENPKFKNLFQDKDYLFKKLLPWLPSFLLTLIKINRLNIPVEKYLRKFTNNQSLIDIISQHFFKNIPSFFGLGYFSLFLNYFYPIGGTGILSSKLEEKVLKFGVKILKDTRIEKIDVESKTLIDQKNNSYQYKYLIWAADIKNFYNITNVAKLKEKIVKKFEKIKNKMLNNRGGDSVFEIFIEVDEKPEVFAKISNGHLIYTPSKKGLAEIHRQELNELIINWANIDKKDLIDWLDKFLTYNTYEISIPSLRDSNMSIKDKTGLNVNFFIEYDIFKNSIERGWYDEIVSYIEKKVINILSNTIYSNLNNKIIKYFSYTPISINQWANTSEGAITGWAFGKNIPVVNKMISINKSIITPFPDIFQAGQWVYSPSGVPIAILTGKIAADEIIKKLSIKIKQR